MSDFPAQLERNGPQRCEAMSPAEARRWCEALARSHGENFPVITRFLPPELVPDFAAVYAFCRWADDLGDEVGDRDRSLALLSWWREELGRCFAGEPRHPVFVALAPTIRTHDLPRQPFEQLIDAFEQDQRVTRYRAWSDVIDYCRRSADPVGRLVLMLLHESRAEDVLSMSDAVCTGLQLTNHWQDVARDMIERDRIYIPSEMHRIERFEERLRLSAKQGHAPDQQFLGEARAAVRACVERTWPYFEKGGGLLDCVSARSRPIIWLFLQGGMSVLRQIEAWNYETVIHRPSLSRVRKAWLVGRAWWMWRGALRGEMGGAAATVAAREAAT
jgi:squalene synthase HpnC